MLLRLWHRPVASALTWKLPYGAGAAIKKEREKKRIAWTGLAQLHINCNHIYINTYDNCKYSSLQISVIDMFELLIQLMIFEIKKNL